MRTLVLLGTWFNGRASIVQWTLRSMQVRCLHSWCMSASALRCLVLNSCRAAGMVFLVCCKAGLWTPMPEPVLSAAEHGPGSKARRSSDALQRNSPMTVQSAFEDISMRSPFAPGVARVSLASTSSAGGGTALASPTRSGLGSPPLLMTRVSSKLKRVPAPEIAKLPKRLISDEQVWQMAKQASNAIGI